MLLLCKPWSLVCLEVVWRVLDFTRLDQMLRVWNLVGKKLQSLQGRLLFTEQPEKPKQSVSETYTKYASFVNEIAYSYTECSDYRTPSKFPITTFFSHDIFKNLTILKFHGSPQWLDEKFLSEISKSKLSKTLTTLSITSLKTISDIVLIKTIDKFINLKHLCLSNCGIDDRVLTAISNRFLTSLDVGFNELITSEGIRVFSEITTLNIENCYNVCDFTCINGNIDHLNVSGIATQKLIDYILININRLDVLEVGYSDVSDVSLQQLFKRFCFRKVSVKGCKKLTLNGIKKIGKNGRFLNEFDFSSSSLDNGSNEGVVKVVDGFGGQCVCLFDDDFY